MKTIDFNAIALPDTLDTAAQHHIYRITDEYYADIAEAEQRVFLLTAAPPMASFRSKRASNCV
jgi:aspartate/methionine/tyrosine aminotransferase